MIKDVKNCLCEAGKPIRSQKWVTVLANVTIRTLTLLSSF